MPTTNMELQMAISGNTPETGSFSKLRGPGLDAVRWTKGFWADRFELCRRTVIPRMKEALEHPDNAARLSNFRVTAGLMEGGHCGVAWSDGDCYKWLEAMARVYAVTREDGLDREMDEWIGLIAKAQHADGYINTQVQLDPAGKRWTVRRLHELYNLGHLMTAASVHFRATGKDSFLAVARRAADCVYRTFAPRPPELAHGAWNPAEIMGLVDLYRVTGERRYLDLAGVFVDMRGSRPWPADRPDLDDPDPGDQTQDRVPLREETEAVGHAVTGTYLWCGAADVYAETGDQGLLDALERIWHDVTGRKMYVTGAVGAYHQGISVRYDKVHEAFGRAYELPAATAYNETCANAGNAMWNRRMLDITGEARFADVMELALYNSVLSGMSLSGDRFCYTNPLARDKGAGMLTHDSAERWSVFSCYCCPPQVARILAGLNEWACGVSEEGVWMHLYGGFTLRTTVPAKGRIGLTVRTDYPWDGRVKVKVDEAARGQVPDHAPRPGMGARGTGKGQWEAGRPGAGAGLVLARRARLGSGRRHPARPADAAPSPRGPSRRGGGAKPGCGRQGPAGLLPGIAGPAEGRGHRRHTRPARCGFQGQARGRSAGRRDRAGGGGAAGSPGRRRRRALPGSVPGPGWAGARPADTLLRMAEPGALVNAGLASPGEVTS